MPVKTQPPVEPVGGVSTHRPGMEAQYRRLAIPWQVALPQSPPPLRQVILLYSHLSPFSNLLGRTGWGSPFLGCRKLLRLQHIPAWIVSIVIERQPYLHCIKDSLFRPFAKIDAQIDCAHHPFCLAGAFAMQAVLHCREQIRPRILQVSRRFLAFMCAAKIQQLTQFLFLCPDKSHLFIIFQVRAQGNEVACTPP